MHTRACYINQSILYLHNISGKYGQIKGNFLAYLATFKHWVIATGKECPDTGQGQRGIFNTKYDKYENTIG